MAQPPLNVKLTLPARPGLSGRPGIVQVLQTNPITGGRTIIQQRPPTFKTFNTIRSFIPSSQCAPINTNTAVQYVRKPEMTVISTANSYVAAPTFSAHRDQIMTPVMALIQPTATNPAGMAPQVNTTGIHSNLTNSRKPCNCTKSHCLKLYCECFAQGQLCQNCNCHNCMNNLSYEEERGRAIKMTLERNPNAFHPKIGRGDGERKHTKGCNCKRSGCLKNYCECYEAKISCSDLCRCQGCRNTEDSVERRSLMRLAAMGSLRSRQPAAYKKHLVKPHPETLPHVFFTWEVIEATVGCLLAQAEEAERRDLAPAAQERVILEEFGRIMMHVIDSASKAQVRSSVGGLPGSHESECEHQPPVPHSVLHDGSDSLVGGLGGRLTAGGGGGGLNAATVADAARDVLLGDDEEDDEDDDDREVDEDDDNDLIRDIGIDEDDDEEDDNNHNRHDEDMFDDEDDDREDELGAGPPGWRFQHHRQPRHNSQLRTGRRQQQSRAVPQLSTLMTEEGLSDDEESGGGSRRVSKIPLGSYSSQRFRQAAKPGRASGVGGDYHTRRSGSGVRPHELDDPDAVI